MVETKELDEDATPTVVFEDLLELVGGTGRWQMMVMTLAALGVFQVPLHSLGSAFISGDQQYRCLVPGENTETSDYNPTNETTWKNINQWILTDNVTEEWKKCTLLAVRGDRQSGEIECQSWVYSHRVYLSTIVQDWDLVCSRKWMKSTVQSSYMLGCLIGSMLTGVLSDRYGRRWTICLASLVFFVFNMASSFATTYSVFILLRFLAAIPRGGLYCTLFILCVELAGTRRRAAAGLMINIPYALGMVLLSALAYWIRSWMVLQLSMASFGALLFVYWLLLPESPRWLILHGQMDRAQKELERAASWNKHVLTPADKLELRCKMERYQQSEMANCNGESSHSGGVSSKCHQKINTELKNGDINVSIKREQHKRVLVCQSLLACPSTICELKRLVDTPHMRHISLAHFFNWLIIALCYYGVTFDAARLSSNPYLAIALSGTLEIPAYLCSLWLVTVLGRRCSVLLTHSLTAMSLLLMLAIPRRNFWIGLVLQMTGRFATTASYGIIYLYSSECFPTVLRNLGVGLCGTFEDVGSMTAPYVVDLLGEWHWSVPSVVFVSGTLLAALAILRTPETAQTLLPDTVKDVQHRLELNAESNSLAKSNDKTACNGEPHVVNTHL